MYSISSNPTMAKMLAGQQIDEQIRTARNRRLARDARAARREPAQDFAPQPRKRPWSFVLLRRALG